MISLVVMPVVPNLDSAEVRQETKKVTTSRAIVLILRKKESASEYWLRLTKEKPNRNWIKTDFSKVSGVFIVVSRGYMG